MPLSATTGRLLVLAALLASPALVQAQETHDTGTVTLEVRNDGFIGASGAFGGGGFTLNGGANTLFEGQLIVGVSQSQVSGEAYAGTPGQGASEWVPGAGVTALTPPFAEPYEEFDEGFEASFDDSAAPNPIGLDVLQASYSATGDGYVITEHTITNTTSSALSGVYVGIFADWDVGDATANLGGYDAAAQLLYVYDTAGGPGYFGVAALGTGSVSGWELDAGAGGNPTEAHLYDAMSNGGGFVPTIPEDRRTILGVGPYDIPAGGSIVVQFAFVGGADLEELTNNALEAQDAVATAIEAGPDGAPGTHALSAAYPNPSHGQARLTLEVAEAQDVHVAVYDALGRQVAVLHDGLLAPGTEHALRLDASALPSGVYLVRVTGERFSDARQLTLIH